MGTLSGGERRRYERRERDDFALRLTRAGQPLPDVQLRDATPYGLGVSSAGELQAGQKLSFELRFPDGSVTGQAVVVWAEPFHMGYRGGLRLGGLGFFARRRLRKALARPRGEAAKGGLLDAVLLVAAAAVAAMVAADLVRDPASVKALLAHVLGSGPR